MTTLSKKQRKMRNRILIAAALLVLVKLLPLTGWVRACAVWRRISSSAMMCCGRRHWALSMGRSLTKTS